MQEKLTIARPYAAAAFEYADANNDVDAWSAMLASLAEAVTNPQMRPLINHPRVSDDQVREILRDILGSALNDQRSNFIDVLLEAERLELAPEITELFERRKSASAGVVEVHVETAFEMSRAEQESIASAVNRRLGKACEVSTTINPELIGGAIIKVGDSVIDISLRGRLRSLEQRLS